MLYLNPLGIEIFIKRSASNTVDAYWDNYDLVIWKKNNNGYTNMTMSIGSINLS